MKTTKEQVSAAIQDALDGNLSPLKAYGMLKDFESEIKAFIEAAKEQIKDYALEEATKYDGKTFESEGYKFEMREGRKTYSFKHIPQWNAVKSKLSSIEGLAKAAAQPNMLGKAVIDEDTGEVIQPAQVSFSDPVLIAKPIN